MKRFLLLAVMCMLGLFGLNAQENSFSFNFDDGSLEGWRNIDADGDNYVWITTPEHLMGDMSSCTGYNHTKGVLSFSYTLEGDEVIPDNYLVTTQAYDITSASKLSWYAKYTDEYYDVDYYSIVVSEDGDNFFEILSDQRCIDGVYERELSLSEYAGKKYYLEFRHYLKGTEVGDGIVIDNITLTASEGGETPGQDDEIVEIVVGTSDGTPTAVVPFRNNVAASYTQSIYPQAEIGGAATITAVAFNCAAPTETTTANVKIYIGETDKTTHVNYLDWLENPTLVYEGEVTIGGEEWETFTFNAPYEYSGTKNLVIAVSSENTTNMNLKWHKHAEDGTKPTLHNTNANAGSEPANVATVKGYRPVIKLTTIGGNGGGGNQGGDDENPITLEAPVVAATALSATEIKLEWEAVADTATYQIYFGEENIGTTKETAFTVINCVPETEHCFTVVAELGDVKSEASEPACATTLAEGEEPDPIDPIIPGEETTVFIGENGEFASYYSPIYDYYNNYGITQQIYTADEIGVSAGTITSIAFKSKSGGGCDRNISVYLSNTDKQYYTGNMDWVLLTEDDAAVFEGTITTPTNGEWLTIELTTPFEYDGGNLAVTVNDKTGSYGSYSQFIQWESYSTGKSETSPRSLYHTNFNSEIPYTGLASRYGTLNAHNYAAWGQAPDNEYINSKVKFTIIPSLANVEVPVAVSLGKVLLADYWTEKTSVKVNVKPVNTTITDITVDNDFFVLPAEIDYTANTVTFDLSYNRNAQVSGDVNGTITVTYAEGTKTFPVTATVYTPVKPDVFELAEEVTFTENAYTNTPEFTNLNDNYILPQEINDGNSPDAVYAFELEKDANLTAVVTGTKANVAIYKEDFNGEGGPSSNNAYNGVSFTQKNFLFNFDDGTMEGWNIIDEDGDGYNWELVSEDGYNYLISYSWKRDNDGVTVVTEANNVLITENTYNITANSKLSFDAYCYSHDFELYKDYIRVEISKDGEYFTLIEKVLPAPIEFGNTVVDLGAKFAELGIEYGEYHIALRHQEKDKYFVCLDNIQLINENLTRNEEKLIDAVYYPAGKYYLLAAAETDFTVSISYEEVPITPPTEVFATVTESSVTLTWDAVEKAESYNIYRGETLLDNVTEPTYTEEGLSPYTEYCYIIKSVVGELESFGTEEICVKTLDLAITTPANLTATVTSESSITLTWDAVQNATGYNVYTYIYQDVVIIATIAETTYTVTDLEPNTEYCYMVSAVRNDNETEKSEAVCETTSDLLPYAPTNLVATALNESTIALTWQKGENATSYNVYRNNEFIINLTGLLYSDKDLTPNTQYCYVVKGVRGELESEEASNEACATTEDGTTPEPEVPAAPVNLSATVEQDVADYEYKYRITMMWEAVEGAEYYNVYVNTTSATDFYMGFTTGTSYIAGTNEETTLEFYVTTVIDEMESEPSEKYEIIVKDDAVEELTASFNIYPNPVENELFIETEMNVEEISIYDIYGRQQAVSCQLSAVNTIDVANLNAGVYFVKIVTDNGEAVKRFVKK